MEHPAEWIENRTNETLSRRHTLSPTPDTENAQTMYNGVPEVARFQSQQQNDGDKHEPHLSK